MLDSSQVAELVEQVADAVVARAGERSRPLRGTYRLQFHADFTFHHAAAIVPYLQALGVSHVYASPYMRARSDSRHGYDVCDFNQLNPALGGEDGYREFVESLAAHEMSHIVDVVPNHMAASGQENPWWRDILENGPASPYSGFFDIDWKPIKAELANRVLIPVLGAQYGDVLERGELRLEHVDGGFQLRYFDRTFPLGPKTVLPLLAHDLDRLRERLGAESESLVEYQSILTALEHLPPPTVTETKAVHERQREKEVVKRRLRDLESREPAVAEFIAANLALYDGTSGAADAFDRLDRLLQGQSYRLCHWRAASDEINYRRFFDVNDLAAACVEKPDVFHAMHRLVGRLLREGAIAGLRIDHVDGLSAPETYLRRLQWTYLAEMAHEVFNAAASEPAADLQLCCAVEADSQAAATEYAVDGGPALATAATAAQVYRLGPAVLHRVCRRLGLRSPDDADLAAVFGPGGVDVPLGLGGARDVEPTESGAADGSQPLYVLVEKILGPEEPLPETWPVAGTTGYEYLQLLNGLFVVPEGFAEIEKQYVRFTGEKRTFAEVVHDCKRLILRFAMASELQMLAHGINRLSEQHRRSRDFTLNALRYALREVLASFPVYRTYPGPDGVSDRDRRFIGRAIAVAKRRNRAMDPTTYDFIRDVLLLRHPPGLEAEAVRAREEFVGRFQQVTSPVMAKGVEDTAFYVYTPLASVNEVGGGPASPTTRLAEFHERNKQRSLRQRGGLLATTTHDTKRTEDVRARLSVLSEIPMRWRSAVQRWSRLTKRWRSDVDGSPAPGPEDEYLFYQSLLGIWPVGKVDAATRAAVVERLQTYMEKATHEAKQRTSWINPHAEYDAAVRRFVAQCLTPGLENAFLNAFQSFHRRIVDAGFYTALAQTVLKLTSPGVPDIYQGQELWDFSLVDPDNRRPVDYRRRRALLDQLKTSWNHDRSRRAELAASLARTPRDDRLKLLATWRLLTLRRERTGLFETGEYRPLFADGAAGDHLTAYAWCERGANEGSAELIVAVPRWWLKAGAAAGVDDVTESMAEADRVWKDTEVEWPGAGRYRNVFTDEPWTAPGPRVRVADLLRRFPVGVFRKESESEG